jgi:hypothetical protein
MTLLLANAAAASSPFTLPAEEPQDLTELRDQISQIDGAQTAAACGGLIADESVGDTLGDGGVAEVTGAPGRTGKPLADIPSGLGVKEEAGGQLDDGFQFPDTTTGFSTRCEPGTPKLRKFVFDYERLSYVRFPLIDAPDFGDPPCLTTPGDCEDFCKALNDYTYADCAVLKGDTDRGIGCALWCEKEVCTDDWVGGSESCNESLSALTNGALPDSPEVPPLRTYKGRELWQDENGQFVWHFSNKEPALDEEGNPVTFYNTEEVQEDIVVTPPEPVQYPNCVPCTGGECRCSLQPVLPPEKNPECLLVLPDVDVGAQDLQNLNSEDAQLWTGCRNVNTDIVRNDSRSFDGDNVTTVNDCIAGESMPSGTLRPGVYASFFRQYAAAMRRRAFTQVVPTDQAEKTADIACYGFYDEFNPLDRRTKMTERGAQGPLDEPADIGGPAPENDDRHAQDARCVINLNTEDFPQTQRGKGFLPVSPDAESFTPSARSPAGISPWYQELAGAFSMLHTTGVSDDPDPLTDAVLGLRDTDTAKLQAMPATHRATLPDFDESAARRTITGWWAQMNSVLAEALSPPRLTLLLPSLQNATISSTDPLFDDAIPPHVPMTDPTAPFEVQLGVGEDLVGRVAEFLTRNTVLHVVQEPVPVLVPAATMDDLHALSQSWCNYILQKPQSAKGCDRSAVAQSFPKVATFMDKLDDYADRIEAVTSLRAQLDKTLANLLQSQQDSLQVIADWKTEATAVLADYLAAAERLRGLRERWQAITRDYSQIGQIVNMPWCMNQRFTLPIYWLLDPWLPSRAQDGAITRQHLPLPFFASRQADLVLNFSLLHIDRGDIRVPVLRPIQVTIDLNRLAPPGTAEASGSANDQVPVLPDLPSLDAIISAMESANQTLAAAQVQSEAPLPEVPEPISDEQISGLESSIDQADIVVSSMNDAYTRFWEPLLPKFAGEREALSCQNWGEGICHYSEMELLETLMRMMSRVAVYLQEDLAVLHPFGRVVSTSCTPDQGGCLPLAPVLTTAPEGWQVKTPSNESGDFDTVRRDVRTTTLPEKVDDLNVKNLTVIPWSYSGPDLLPGLALPDETMIRPESASSSSAS